MQRRKFLSLVGLGAAVLAVAPAAVRAEDYRTLKPNVWKAKTVEDAVKSMYGTTTFIEKGVKVTTPDVAASGGAVPVNVQSDIPAKTVSLFQDANPESAVIVFEPGKYSIINYDLKMKLKSVGDPITITVVVEGLDGKLYAGKRTLDVALGGCEG
jgi:sulfur-oxidizing protein SoxY